MNTHIYLILVFAAVVVGLIYLYELFFGYKIENDPDAIADGKRKLIKTFDDVWVCQQYSKSKYRKGGVWKTISFKIAKHAIPLLENKSWQSPIWRRTLTEFNEKSLPALRYLAKFEYKSEKYKGHIIDRLPHLHDVGYPVLWQVLNGPGWCTHEFVERQLCGGRALGFSKDDVNIVKYQLDYMEKKKNNPVVKKEAV